MLNSVRLTGHDYPIVALDAGLDREQRRALEQHCEVVTLPATADLAPTLWKPFAATLCPSGVVVFLDGDMIVTRSIEPLVEQAERGEICAVLDPGPNRWMAEWQEIFELQSPLRREPYVNCGLLVFSTEKWPGLLQRWWRACRQIPSERVVAGTNPLSRDRPRRAIRRWLGGENPDMGKMPVGAGDQDAFNALLMSEIPAGAVTVGSPDCEAFVWDLRAVRVQDTASLNCEHKGQALTILHYNGDTKPWEWQSWNSMSMRDSPYISVFKRVTQSQDVPLRLLRRSVPVWLHPGPLSLLALRFLDAIRWTQMAVRRLLPEAAKVHLRSLRSRLRDSRLTILLVSGVSGA